MDIFVGIFIFCVILFLYLHVKFQLKTSDDLEVFELENPDKTRLEELCDLRQPLMFTFQGDHMIPLFNRTYLSKEYSGFDVKMRSRIQKEDADQIDVPLRFSAAMEVIDKDKEKTYFTENNHDFLVETGLTKNLRSCDSLIRPYMYCNGTYDFVTGSVGTYTPLRYEVNYRSYIYVTEGDISVRLTAPKNTKYLNEKRDYENFEFCSDVDIWNVQPEHSATMEKVKHIDVKLRKGAILFLPPYWWYSIRFDQPCSLLFFRYRTYMNNVAILPHLAMCTLQNHNIKWDVVSKVKSYVHETSERNEEAETEQVATANANQDETPPPKTLP